MITDAPWVKGTARSCSFDGQSQEMHCFSPDSLLSPKTDYLVDADFSSPVRFDANHWSMGSDHYPYSITCRLDSFEHATCHQSN